MKLTNLIFLLGLLTIATTLPWIQQIALANALEVGRN
jgi:hypothetical protein